LLLSELLSHFICFALPAFLHIQIYKGHIPQYIDVKLPWTKKPLKIDVGLWGVVVLIQLSTNFRFYLKKALHDLLEKENILLMLLDEENDHHELQQKNWKCKCNCKEEFLHHEARHEAKKFKRKHRKKHHKHKTKQVKDKETKKMLKRLRYAKSPKGKIKKIKNH
jgi:hypothetical protein